MLIRAVLLSLSLTLTAGVVFAQEETKKNALALNPEAEVLFANGSIVRMVVIQENLEVATKYGKLTIPIKDVRRVDFGVHLSGEVESKLDAALKKLNSPQYKLREAAVHDLVDIGELAYPTLTAVAAKSSGPEMTQRIAQAIQRIKAKVPENKLRLREDDIITTPTFTIIGKIVNPTLKAKAEYFGDLNLCISSLRTIRWSGAGGEVEINVEAAKYGSVSGQWLDTGIRVDGISQLTLVATGQVDLWPQGPGQYMSSPKGYPQAGKRNGHVSGTLLGRIGETGEVFTVGDRYQATPNREGKLYLQIAANPWNSDSSGSYQVRVSLNFVGQTP